MVVVFRFEAEEEILFVVLFDIVPEPVVVALLEVDIDVAPDDLLEVVGLDDVILLQLELNVVLTEAVFVEAGELVELCIVFVEKVDIVDVEKVLIVTVVG